MKFVAFGRKNTGISQINGLGDLRQGRPSKVKAKDFASRPRPRTYIRKAKVKVKD